VNKNHDKDALVFWCSVVIAIVAIIVIGGVQ
jgi:hypothetical protein